MRRPETTRRAGFSLTEVLITLLILTIGLISLMTLFPYGAIQLAQSVRDDRAAYAATNAHSQFRLAWQEIWTKPDGTPRRWDVPNPLLSDGVTPNPEYPGVKQAYPDLARLEVGDPTDPNDDLLPPFESYPVFIDPYGLFAHVASATGPAQQWLAHGQPSGTGNSADQLIPRISLNGDTTTFPPPPVGKPTVREFFPFTRPQELIRRTSLLDDISFGEGGEIEYQNTSEVQRGGDYTWAWMVQRPPGVQPFRGEVTLTVVVFAGRPLDVPAEEFAYPATFSLRQPFVTVQMPDSATVPPVAKDGWLLDASRLARGTSRVQRAQFYRVQELTQQDADPTRWDIELQTPSLYQSSAANGGRVYFLGRVAEEDTLIAVFERGLVTPDDEPKPSGEF